MQRSILQRFRHGARRIAALAVLLFALNWLGLALAPCAMAFDLAAGAPDTSAAVAAHEHCPHCPPPDVPPCHGASSSANDAACGATPKPALEAREVKLASAPLLVALSGPTLVLEPVPVNARRGYAADDPAPCPELAPPDRYCRRLE